MPIDVGLPSGRGTAAEPITLEPVEVRPMPGVSPLTVFALMVIVLWSLRGGRQRG